MDDCFYCSATGPQIDEAIPSRGEVLTTRRRHPYIETNVDTRTGDYRSLVGTGFDPEVGAATRSTGASLTRRYHRFRHRFIAPEDDSSARVTFDLAQSAVDVQIDDVGLYEGRGCGTP